MQTWLKKHLKEIEDLLDKNLLKDASKTILNMHPADVSRIIESLSEENKVIFFKSLKPTFAAEILVELSDYSRDVILNTLSTNQISAIVDDMPSDEATDIVADLPTAQAKSILAHINSKDSVEVQKLLQYEEASAGGLMQLELVSANFYQTVSNVINIVRGKKDEIGELHYIYITNDQNILLGYVPVSELLISELKVPMYSLLKTCPVVVKVHEDQEIVGHKFRRYNIVSAPVVDIKGRLLGRITIDDVMEVLEEETREDLLHMAGVSNEEELFLTKGSFKTFRLRLPWILTNMLTTLICGYFLYKQKTILDDDPVLLIFVPSIMAMAGNVGIQSSTIIVRNLAIGQTHYINLWQILFKEIRIALGIGIVCSIVVSGITFFFCLGQISLIIAVGSSMISVITIASITGTITPFLFKSMNIDPAISSGPIITTFNDIVGMFIYFVIITILVL